MVPLVSHSFLDAFSIFFFNYCVNKLFVVNFFFIVLDSFIIAVLMQNVLIKKEKRYEDFYFYRNTCSYIFFVVYGAEKKPLFF
jgi:hypothetical protein